MKVEIREVETVFGETSPGGDTTRKDRSWQLGAEIEGVWTPFATVNQGQYDHFAQRQEAASGSEGGKGGSGGSSGGGSKTDS